MNHKILLRKFNGHWFMCVGPKGYACTTSFEEFLNRVKPACVFVSDEPKEPWSLVKVYKGEKAVRTDFEEVSSKEIHNLNQCPKMFEDLGLPEQFYINRGNS